MSRCAPKPYQRIAARCERECRERRARLPALAVGKAASARLAAAELSAMDWVRKISVAAWRHALERRRGAA